MFQELARSWKYNISHEASIAKAFKGGKRQIRKKHAIRIIMAVIVA